MSAEDDKFHAATVYHQRTYDALHSSAATVELKTKALFKEFSREINALPSDADYSQPDVSLVLSQRILQDEAEYMGFPAQSHPYQAETTAESDAGSSAVIHIDVQQKSAASALSKLCEMFIMELTHRAYHQKDSKGSNLSQEDVLQVIKLTEHFDLFIDYLNDLKP